MRAAITLAVLIAVSGWGAETTPVLDLNYHADRLTVRIQHVPTDRVAAALGKATGADVQGRFDGEVTVAFEDVPLPEALRRLFGERTFSLKYSGGRLRTIDFAGGPSTPEPQAGNRKMTEPDAAATPFSLVSGASDSTIPVSTHLARVLGTRLPTFAQLIEAARGNPDPRVRHKATQAAARAIDRDANLRSMLFNQLASVDDADIAMQVSQQAGGDGENWLRNFARQLRRRDLRTRTRRILRELPAPEQGAAPGAAD